MQHNTCPKYERDVAARQQIGRDRTATLTQHTTATHYCNTLLQRTTATQHLSEAWARHCCSMADRPRSYCDTIIQHPTATHYCNTLLQHTTATHYLSEAWAQRYSLGFRLLNSRQAEIVLQHTTATHQRNTILWHNTATDYSHRLLKHITATPSCYILPIRNMSATLLLNSRQAEVVLLFRLHVKPLVHLLMQQPVVLQYRIVRYLLLNRDVPVIDIRSIVLYWCAAAVCCSTTTTATHQYNTILSLIYAVSCCIGVLQ